MQLTAPRDQLSRISSRLKQIGGLASLDLAWEVFAFSHVGVSAAVEEAFSQASSDAMQKLRKPALCEPERPPACGRRGVQLSSVLRR